MPKIALLASGDLGLGIVVKIHKKHGLVFVMTDKKSIQVADFCKKNEVPFFVGNPNRQETVDFYSRFSVDIIISVNYIFLVDQRLIDHPKILIFNLHGSLLPKYRGRTPHVWSIINGEQECGITAHLIDEGCDTGDIIKQVRIPIRNTDTGADILNKYKQKYFPIIEEVISDIEEGSLRCTPQKNEFATYFGKRTPDDGMINWDWQKERIHNWVRAQAGPYPGAFTYYNEEKVIIDRILFSNHGFDSDMANGLVIGFEQQKPIVKVQNGAVLLDAIRSKHTQFMLNEKFHD